MKNAKHILIATLVILGIILLSNAVIFGTLCYFFSPEIILGGDNAGKRVGATSEIAVQRPSHVTAESPDRKEKQP